MVTHPHSIPLSSGAAQELCAGAETFAGVRGAFLCFVMIPVEERIGEWRFAGTGDTLGAAVGAIDAFMREMRLAPEGGASPALHALSVGGTPVFTDVNESWSYYDLPHGEIGGHTVVLFAEGQAPYDDFGFCILELQSLVDSPYLTRAPETDRPDSWPEGREDEE